MIIGERCDAKHPVKGTQCGLPKQHCGRHQNGTIVPSWDESEHAPVNAGAVEESDQ